MLQHLLEYLSKGENFLVATMFGVVNMLVRPPKETIAAYLAEFFISVAVAVIVGFVCADMGISEGLTFSFVAIAALIARDVILLVTGFGTFITTHRNPLYYKLMSVLFNKLSGSLNPLDKDKK